MLKITFLNIKAFGITLIFLAVLLFSIGMYEVPPVTSCMPNYCNDEGGIRLRYRAEFGLLVLGMGSIPAIFIALLAGHVCNRKKN